MPKEEFRTASVTIAASLFRNVFGETAATRALPALVALSALGHLLGVAFVVRKSSFSRSPENPSEIPTPAEFDPQMQRASSKN